MGQIVSDVTKVLDYKDSKNDAASQRQQILAQIAEDEEIKKNLIKKVLSTQRAKYGATGNSGTGFSEQAVLKRLRDETAEPYDTKYKNNLQKIQSTRAKQPSLLKNWLSKIDKIVG